MDRRLDKRYLTGAVSAMHNHLNCMQCGTAVDAPLDYRTKIDTTVAGMTGRQINRHRIIVEGLCSKCQRECEKGWLTKK